MFAFITVKTPWDLRNLDALRGAHHSILLGLLEILRISQPTGSAASPGLIRSDKKIGSGS